jgi:hypothetical protein
MHWGYSVPEIAVRGDSHHVLVTQCAPSRTHKTVMLTGPVPSPAGKRYGPANIIGYLNFTRNVAP